MNLLLISVGVSVATLLGLLIWSVGRKTSQTRSVVKERDRLTLACKHVMNLSQIRQALDSTDLNYLRERLNSRAVRDVRRERRRVVTRFMEGLHDDFKHLMEAAQFVAAFSPEVVAHLEWKRFRLGLEFELKYQLIKAKFALGALSFRPMGELAMMISSLALDLERTVSEIGAAAALPSKQQSVDR